MVSLTPRLDNFDWTISLLGKLLDQAPLPTIPDAKQPILSTLTEVHMDFCQQLLDDHAHLHLFDLHIGPLVLRLPALKKFKATGGRLKHMIRDWKCEERRSNVTHLIFKNCDLGTDALVSFIRSCSALNSFLCLRSRIHQAEPPVGVVWPMVICALESHKKTLERLAITSYSKFDVDFHPEEPGPTDVAVTSLRRLENLRYLDLDDESIFGLSSTDGWRVRASVKHSAHSLLQLLPSSLEHLVLREGRQYDPVPYRPAHWCLDLYQFGDILMRHDTLRRLDAIGFESVDRFNGAMIQNLQGLLIKRNTRLKAYRPSGQSTCMMKKCVDRSAVMEPPWLTRGRGAWMNKEEDSEVEDDE